MIHDRMRSWGFGHDSVSPPASLNPVQWVKWLVRWHARWSFFTQRNWEGKRRIQPLGRGDGVLQYRIGVAVRWRGSLFCAYRLRCRPRHRYLPIRPGAGRHGDAAGLWPISGCRKWGPGQTLDADGNVEAYETEDGRLVEVASA